ncbi:MAG: response regulator [Syntrophotalea acetylenica]|uniref:Two-component system response regulator n=1 Tax=Syntrophotalea acetylenica TaxID=29542 RepID=A0A1L3GJL1_SYNAC|nr:two-component system response regulator [Syntrophotalea acetylenica]APG45356.1 two-component system response regulator [Syntrophotalea acetylenica]MDD4456571.1 response regulator [Syntrophotalea acetylenica]
MVQSHEKVLVVDDEENARIALRAILQEEGYEVDSVANGYEALEFLRQHKVNVVISDLRMPEMNGLSFLRELNRHYPSTRVIMVTAYGGVESYLEAIQLGAFEYIHKPVKVDELKNIMHKMLAENRSARAN